MAKKKNPEREWYAKGLHFHCTECGGCCTGSPGYVDFTPAELEAMARRLGLLPDEFLREYARRRNGYWSLREVEVNGEYDCVFLRRDPDTGTSRCAVYEVRPSQCRTWPFWPENLESKEAWEGAAQQCPGMVDPEARRGKLFKLEDIRRLSSS